MKELMRLGVYVYGLATVAAGIFDLLWGDFDTSHQPIQAFGDHIPGRELFVYITAIWMITGGAAILWRRTAKAGAAALAGIYFIFAVFWFPRCLYGALRTWCSNSGLYRRVGWSRHTTHRGRRRRTRLRVPSNAQFVMAANDSYRSLDIRALLRRLRLGAFD